MLIFIISVDIYKHENSGLMRLKETSLLSLDKLSFVDFAGDCRSVLHETRPFL